MRDSIRYRNNPCVPIPRYANQYLNIFIWHRLVFKTGLFKVFMKSLLLCRFLYCLPVWGPPLTATGINRLETVQNRAVMCVNL